MGGLLGRREVRGGVLAALCRRPGDQEKCPPADEPAQQRGRAKGTTLHIYIYVYITLYKENWDGSSMILKFKYKCSNVTEMQNLADAKWNCAVAPQSIHE